MLENTKPLPTELGGLPTIVVEFAPMFEIVNTANWKAGNCYYKSKYRLRTRTKLKSEDLNTWVKDLCMPGQEYFIRSIPEHHTGVWIEPDHLSTTCCVPFYEYLIETGVDSGD